VLAREVFFENVAGRERVPSHSATLAPGRSCASASSVLRFAWQSMPGIYRPVEIRLASRPRLVVAARKLTADVHRDLHEDTFSRSPTLARSGSRQPAQSSSLASGDVYFAWWINAHGSSNTHRRLSCRNARCPCQGNTGMARHCWPAAGAAIRTRRRFIARTDAHCNWPHKTARRRRDRTAGASQQAHMPGYAKSMHVTLPWPRPPPWGGPSGAPPGPPVGAPFPPPPPPPPIAVPMSIRRRKFYHAGRSLPLLDERTSCTLIWATVRAGRQLGSLMASSAISGGYGFCSSACCSRRRCFGSSDLTTIRQPRAPCSRPRVRKKYRYAREKWGNPSMTCTRRKARRTCKFGELAPRGAAKSGPPADVVVLPWSIRPLAILPLGADHAPGAAGPLRLDVGRSTPGIGGRGVRWSMAARRRCHLHRP